MAKAILICGKLCSGKSHYARQLRAVENAVILSTDEATFDLIANQQGEFYNVFAKRVNEYLKKKAAEIVLAGASVILDWDFWSYADRKDISDFFKANGVPYEWHYIAVDQSTWKKQIEERNRRIERGEGSSDFYVDEGLLEKCLNLFEEPAEREMDIWHRTGW